MMQNEKNKENKKYTAKNVIIAVFTLEQIIIIYIIATRKGMSLIDWFSRLF